MVTMATAFTVSFTVSAKPDVEFARSVARWRGFNESRDEYNPFDVLFSVREVVLRTSILV